jgi:GGDEF domain-containing protein
MPRQPKTSPQWSQSIWTTGFESVNEIQLAIIRLLENICQPLQCEGVILDPSFSCGIAVFPLNGDSATKLLTSADRALYHAKGLGEGRFAFAL